LSLSYKFYISSHQTSNGRFLFSNVTALSACLECPERYYCSNRITPIMCPPGYYCPAGSSIATTKPCPLGTWNENVSGAKTVS